MYSKLGRLWAVARRDIFVAHSCTCNKQVDKARFHRLFELEMMGVSFFSFADSITTGIAIYSA